MKNMNGWRVIIAAAALLWGISAYLFGGWRTEMAHANTATAALADEGADRETRLAVLEDRWERIMADLTEIKAAVKEQ